jgi:hypothetical protein
MAGQSVPHPREVVVMARSVVKVKGRAVVVVVERRVVAVVRLVAVVALIFLLPRTKKHVTILLYILHGMEKKQLFV